MTLRKDFPYLYETHMHTCEASKCARSTGAQMAQAAKEQTGLDLDKKKMQLAEPIKALGTYEVPVKLHQKVTAKLSVQVVEG